eukprot:8022903-Pyramimonas_sp.AAC.1
MFACFSHRGFKSACDSNAGVTRRLAAIALSCWQKVMEDSSSACVSHLQGVPTLRADAHIQNLQRMEGMVTIKAQAFIYITYNSLN